MTIELKLYVDWNLPAISANGDGVIITDRKQLDGSLFQAKVYYMDPVTGKRKDVSGIETYSPAEGDIPPAGVSDLSLTFNPTDPPPSGYTFPASVSAARSINALETRIAGDDWIHWPVPLFNSQKDNDSPKTLFTQPHWKNIKPSEVGPGKLPYGYVFGPEWQEAVIFFEDRVAPKAVGSSTPYVSGRGEIADKIFGIDIEYEGFSIGDKPDVGTHVIKAKWKLDEEIYKEKYGLELGTPIEVEKEYTITVVEQEPVIVWDTFNGTGDALKPSKIILATCDENTVDVPYITNSNGEYPIRAIDPNTGEEVAGEFTYSPPPGKPVYENYDLVATFIPTDPNYYTIEQTVSYHVAARQKGKEIPPTMFNALVVSVDSSVGFGGDNSSCSFTLVEDPENEFNINIPPAGTACYFRYKGFKFTGVLQRWNYTESISGKKYNVLLNSVSSFMDGVHVILDKFEGTAFLGDTKLTPWTGQQIPYQNGGVRNLLNPFGYFENYVLGLGGGATDGVCTGGEVDALAGGDDGQWSFDPSLVDEFGIGTWGDSGRNDQGFSGRKLLATIQAISQGGTPHGDKLFFGKTQYKLDLSSLIPLVPEYYRISASPSLDLNSIITDMCELIQHDYVWVLDGKEDDACPDMGGEYLDQDNVIATLKLVDKGSPPSPGIIADFVSSAKDSGKLINSSIGKEFQNEATQKVILGGQATRYFMATQADMIPVFGQTESGGYILSRNFENVQSGAYNDDRKITLFVQASKYSNSFTGGGPRPYTASIAELRAARKGMDSWLSFKWLEQIYLLQYGGADYTSGVFDNYHADFCGLPSFGTPSRLGGLGPNAAFQVMQNSMQLFNGGPVTFSSAERNIIANRFAGYLELNEEGNDSSVWAAVSNCAEYFFGRRFLIFLPKEPGGIENNLKILKDNVDQIPSWELADSAWVDQTPPVLDNPRYYDDSGMLKPINVFPSNCSIGGGVAERFSAGSVSGIATNENGPSFPAGIEWLQLGGLECDLDPYVVVDTGVQAESSDMFTSNNWGFLMMMIKMAQSQGHPWGKGVGSSSSTAVPLGPAVKAPVGIGIPQKSQRYSWGPWYHANHKNGKLDFIYDPELVPQSFGSQQAMSEMAQSQANTGVATMDEAENGSYEIAEYPQYNLADRLLGSGPYVTNISIKIAISGISTSYRFNTWTPDFGKLQKYNQNRMARIWRNKMNSLRGNGSGGSGTGSYRTAREEVQSKDYPKVANTFNPETSAIMGSSGWEDGVLSPGHHEITSSSASTLYSSTAANAGVGPNYKTSFGNSKEQFYAGYSSHRDRNPNQALPSIQDPSMGGEMATGESLASAGFNVYRAGSSNGAILPTSNDLDPYMNYGIFGNNTGGGVVGATEEQNPVEQWIDECMHKDYLFFVYDIQNGFPNTISPYKAKLNESYSGEVLNQMTEARAAGLKGPLVLTGWGFDIANNPVPSDIDNIRNFNTQLLCSRKNWKTGPVKLMWDEERKIWSGGLETLTGTVYEDDIEAPQSPTEPTTFKLKVLRKMDSTKGSTSSLGYADPPEVITCYNRDPNFSMGAGDNSYLTVMRINYEWVPLAGGASVGDIVSFETQEAKEECKQDTHIWWVGIQRQDNADAPGITDPTEFPSGGPGNFDWNGFEPKKPERHADYCQNSGKQGFNGRDAWRDNTEIIYEGSSLDNVATNPGEGLNSHFWIMKTCYPSEGIAEATFEICAGSELQTGHYFGIRDALTSIDGVNPLINETDETFARYFYFVVDGDETGIPTFADYPTSGSFAGTEQEFMELHVKAIHINSDDPPSIVAQKIHYALYGSDIPFTSSADCGKVKINQGAIGLTGDQSNEGLSNLPSCMKLSNFAGGEGFNPEAWGAANATNLVEWINYESGALNDGTFTPKNDAWGGSDGDWSGPNYSGDATIGSIYENGWNETYENPNSLRLDDWLDMVEMLHDMSSYLGNHDYTQNEIINKITGTDPLTGKAWLSECDEEFRGCDGRSDFSSIIGRITQYPCNVTKVPGEICVKENDEGDWEVDTESAEGENSDDCRGYIEIRDPMGAFLNNRFAKDLRGRRGVAMYVWDYQPNGPCGDNPNYYDSHSTPSCYWMIIWMDMFDEIELVSDVIIGTKSVTIEKKKIDVWNHCDLDPQRIEGATCEYEEDGTDPGGSPAA